MRYSLSFLITDTYYNPVSNHLLTHSTIIAIISLLLQLCNELLNWLCSLFNRLKFHCLKIKFFTGSKCLLNIGITLSYILICLSSASSNVNWLNNIVRLLQKFLLTSSTLFNRIQLPVCYNWIPGKLLTPYSTISSNMYT